jgi:hypothetical protein
MQDILRIFESTEKVKQEGDSPLRVMTKEFFGEIARQLAVSRVSKAQHRSQAPLISNTHPMMWQSSFPSNISLPTDNTGDIFGYRCHICSKCLMMVHLPVFYPPSQQYGAIIEYRHCCDPGLIARNQNLDENDKETRLKIMREYQPQYLKNVVNPWSGGDASIAGIELSSSLSTTPLPNDQIKILHPKDPRRSVTFHYSNEKIVELQADVGVGNPDHWSVRVLRKGRAKLAHNEVQEFLNLVKNATFGIFNLYTPKTDRNHEYQKHHVSGTQKEESPTRCYFMYIIRNE